MKLISVNFSGAIVLGPRIDRYKDKNSTFITGHSIPHISLGGFILAFGFIAFNAGSQVGVCLFCYVKRK